MIYLLSKKVKYCSFGIDRDSPMGIYLVTQYGIFSMERFGRSHCKLYRKFFDQYRWMDAWFFTKMNTITSSENLHVKKATHSTSRVSTLFYRCMSPKYTLNAHNRKFRQKILSFLKKINFEVFHLSLAGKIIVIWSILACMSHFLPWILFVSGGKVVNSYGAFSVFTSYVGYLILWLVFFVTFFALSHTRKEWLRARMPIHLSDGVISFFVGILILVIAFLIAGMNRISLSIMNNVEIGNWLILLGISAVFYIFWWVLRDREDRREHHENRYLNRSREDLEIAEYSKILWKEYTDKEKERKNMSLPF